MRRRAVAPAQTRQWGRLDLHEERFDTTGPQQVLHPSAMHECHQRPIACSACPLLRLNLGQGQSSARINLPCVVASLGDNLRGSRQVVGALGAAVSCASSENRPWGTVCRDVPHRLVVRRLIPTTGARLHPRLQPTESTFRRACCPNVK
eukprot:scaffold46837_cov30-Tisochrysis_lutea.AAC.4